jgi:enoyl-CoA hydratase
VTVLRMEHGKVNAVDTELFEELGTALEEVEAQDGGDESEGTGRAVVLTGSGRAFSAGVDLFRVLEGGRGYLETFLPALTEGLHTLFTFPRPVIAAINGHAIAGGAILACACDGRLMARGSGRVGVPELRVGVPYPTLALEVLRFAVGARHLQELVYRGATYPPEEALARGLVDEVVDAEELMKLAVERARAYAALPARAFRLTKRALRRPVLERWEADAPSTDSRVLDLWSAPETPDAIRAYLEATVGRG